jgi:hypothetical protein
MNGLTDYVPTKANTGFAEWWNLFNEELAKRDLPEASYGDARDSFDVGESPETAADYLLNSNY